MDSNLWHPWLFSPHPTCSNDTLDAFPARPDAATMAVTAAGHRSAPMATRLECRPWIAWPPWLGWLMGGASQAIRNVSCRPLREFLGRRVKLARSSTHHWKPQTKGTRSIYFNKYCLFGIPLRIYNKKSLTMKIENATWNYSPIWNQVSLVRHHLVLKRSNRFHRLAQTPGPSESSWPILTGMLAIVTSMCTALCHLWLGHMAHPIHQVLSCHHVLPWMKARKIWPTRLPFEKRLSTVKFNVLFLEMVTVLCSAHWTLRQSVCAEPHSTNTRKNAWGLTLLHVIPTS